MRIAIWTLLLAGGALLASGSLPVVAQDGADESETEPLKVRAVMQDRPGGSMKEVEVAVHPAPVDPPTVAAAETKLPARDLVLGVVADGQAVAYPVRYLALSEVLNDRVGEVGLAPTW